MDTDNNEAMACGKGVQDLGEERQRKGDGDICNSVNIKKINKTLKTVGKRPNKQTKKP